MTDNPLKNEDFEAIEAAVMETARGRWFLAEHARRQRVAEAAGIIDAIKSLEERMTVSSLVPVVASPAPDMSGISQLIDEAYDHVLTAFGVTKSKASDSGQASSRAEAAKLAAETLRDLRSRMQAMSGDVDASSSQMAETAENIPTEMPAEPELAQPPAPAEFEAAERPIIAIAPEDPIVEQELFGDAPQADGPAEVAAPQVRRPDNHEHLATTLREAIAQVRGPSSDIDALSFEAKSVLFA